MRGTYTTIQGDMWDGIAYKTLGSEDQVSRLMELNPAYLDLYTFPAGIVLTLPEETVTVSSDLPPWKQVPG